MSVVNKNVKYELIEVENMDDMLTSIAIYRYKFTNIFLVKDIFPFKAYLCIFFWNSNKYNFFILTIFKQQIF
jgi:hypothetical protein